MLCKRGLAVMWCLSACVSVTLVNSVEMNKHIFKLFHHWLATPSSFSTPNVMVIFRQGTFPNRVIECRCQRIRGFTTMRYINRLFTYLLTGGVGRNRNSGPIPGFTACCQCCDQLGAINTVSLYRGKLWHLSLIVSVGLGWWWETRTKCLWRSLNDTPKTVE